MKCYAVFFSYAWVLGADRLYRLPFIMTGVIIGSAYVMFRRCLIVVNIPKEFEKYRIGGVANWVGLDATTLSKKEEKKPVATSTCGHGWNTKESAHKQMWQPGLFAIHEKS